MWLYDFQGKLDTTIFNFFVLQDQSAAIKPKEEEFNADISPA